jgi:hypothetical protein
LERAIGKIIVKPLVNYCKKREEFKMGLRLVRRAETRWDQEWKKFWIRIKLTDELFRSEPLPKQMCR